MYIDVEGYGPEWYTLIFCPGCKCVTTSYEDLEENQTEIECIHCQHKFIFQFDKDYPYPRLRIRPAVTSIINFVVGEDGEFLLRGRDQKRVFMYCLMDWENIEDQKSCPRKLTEKVKEALYENKTAAISGFVFSKSRQFELVKQGVEKN